MSNLPKRLLKKIVALEKKIVSYPIENKLNEWKEKRNDKIMNRELLVTDKYGNRYYQHYTNEGIPTKRYVHLNYRGFHKWDEDPTMQAWLTGRRENPPSQEELERIYLRIENLERKGLEWDKKEQLLIDEYNKKRKEALEQSKAETGAIGEGNNFIPGIWKSSNDSNSLDDNESSNKSIINIKNVTNVDSRLLANLNTSLANLSEESIARINEALAEIPKHDVCETKNIHGLIGKYMVDFDKDDEEYRKNREAKLIEQYNTDLAKVDLNEYTMEKMSTRYLIEKEQKEKEVKNELAQLTNIGKKMMDKKDKFKKYKKFRIQFTDIYSNCEI